MVTILPVIWFFIIGFAVMMYVLLDGFVLGIGIISPFADDDSQRTQMMNTAAPIWDGNETWLVMGGAGLMAAFPKAYALVLSALYLPILALLIALIFRGVAFEFRARAERSRIIWTYAFHLGSVIAAFSQGAILGSIVEGIPVHQPGEVISPLAWFSPFVVMTGMAVVFGYALLGSTWVALKTDQRTQQMARDLTRPLMAIVLAFMLLVSVWLPFLSPDLNIRWFQGASFWYLLPIPVLTILVAWYLWHAVLANREIAPFVLSLCLFVLGFIGLVVGIWPHMVPPDLTIWQAASAPSSQGFVLVGAAIMIPVVLAYTVFSYRVFRGKVKADDSFY